MQHRDKIILQKIVSEINIAEDMLGTCDLDKFLNDEKLKRAVSMTIINIGELIKNISDEMRVEHNEVPWKDAAGMRDITAHRYQTLRMEDVYSSAKIDFPQIKQQLLNILNENDDKSEDNNI